VDDAAHAIGASHGLMFERTDDFLRTVLGFLDQHLIAVP
jgi:hypothetical protein